MINWKYVAKRFARRAFNWRYNFREIGKDNANNIRMLQECRWERDQLRANLEAMDTHDKEVIAKLRAELEEALKLAAVRAEQRDEMAGANLQLRADNGALRARLDYAASLIRDVIGSQSTEWWREPAPAPKCKCGHSRGSHGPDNGDCVMDAGGDSGKQCPCRRFHPASETELPAEMLAVLRDKTISLGDHDLCAPCLRSEHPYAHFPGTPCPAPASAQGTTEREIRSLWRYIRAIDLALDKRVSALSERVVHLGQCRSNYCSHGAHGPAAPPQPAPVERNAKDGEHDPCVRCGLGRWRHAPYHRRPVTHPFVERAHEFECDVGGCDANCLCDKCGQPRSAAVHGEGG